MTVAVSGAWGGAMGGAPTARAAKVWEVLPSARLMIARIPSLGAALVTSVVGVPATAVGGTWPAIRASVVARPGSLKTGKAFGESTALAVSATPTSVRALAGGARIAGMATWATKAGFGRVGILDIAICVSTRKSGVTPTTRAVVGRAVLLPKRVVAARLGAARSITRAILHKDVALGLGEPLGLRAGLGTISTEVGRRIAQGQITRLGATRPRRASVGLGT